MNEFPLKKHGFITYNNPKEIERLAKFYAQKRMESNAKLHETAPQYSRGNLGSKVDELGLCAELIAEEFLKQKNILHTPLKIYESTPVSEPDTIIGIFKSDIKGVNLTLDELRVNCESHYKKNSTHYLFIKPFRNENDELNGEAEFWVIPSLYVTYWKIDDKSFTPYFYESIDKINKIFENEK